MLRVSVSVLLLLGAISALAQDVYYTLGEALSRVENTSEYLQEMRETSIKQLTHKTFHSQVLPQISLHASVPSYEKSISMVSQNDGSYVYRSRTYANSELSLGIRQLVPFTGGWLTFKSSLSRLDNLNNTAKTYAYYYNIGKISYKQTIGGYNEYKWLKRKDEADKILENIQHRQNIEKIKFKVVDAFFSLLCAQKRIELTQQNYELAKLVTDAYKDKLESNLISLSISMPLYDGKISSYKLKMEKLRMELLNDKYRVSKDRYIQSMMSELSYISQLVGIISNQRKTLDLLKQEKMLVKQQVNMGRLNSDQYLRIKSSELKASNEYFVYIQEFYLLIFKYRYLALYDILRDKDL